MTASKIKHGCVKTLGNSTRLYGERVLACFTQRYHAIAVSNISKSHHPSQGKKHHVEFITSASRAQAVIENILNSAMKEIRDTDATWKENPCLVQAPCVGLDSEGVRLGRFGRISLLQLALPDGGLFLIDALRPGTVEAISPLLQDPHVVKVMHDCREDSAALFHQHGVLLRSVFDTQAAYASLLQLTGVGVHQVSMSQLLHQKLQIPDLEEVHDMKTLMLKDAKLWARRPLKGALVSYALHGVRHLLPLRMALLEEASGLKRNAQALNSPRSNALEAAALASSHYVNYCFLNSEFSSAQAMAKIGTQLWAFLVARTDSSIYFKLNAGRQGIVNTPSAMMRFMDVQIGDKVLCCVSGVSLTGQYLYLDRYDHDWDYFDHQRRPSREPEVGVYGREHRHKSSLFETMGGHDVDPLLLRALPASDSSAHDCKLDEWEAGPEDLGYPLGIDDA